MTVEDAAELLFKYTDYGLFTSHNTNAWSLSFIQSVVNYTSQNKPLSTEQARVVVRMLSANAPYLLERGVCPSVIENVATRPTYRNQPYISSKLKREVRFLGENLLGFRFKRDDIIVSELKSISNDQVFGLSDLWFQREHKMWVIAVTRDTLPRLINLISYHKFGFDEGVAEYLTRASNAVRQTPAFAADAELGLIAGQVYDNEIVSWFVEANLGGQPV